MIVGIGIDIVAIERIEAMLEKHGDRALRRLYTQTERDYCDRMATPALNYAARFAAKEAFVKALGTGFTSGIKWNEIGIIHDPKGKPLLDMEGRAKEMMETVGATSAYVSLSHDPTHAAAVVVLEKD